MTTNDTYDLLSLLPTTSYTLVYALPLFFVSTLLTFAGCFLTLDRTRTFSSSVPVPTVHGKRPLLAWLRYINLGGGIGGLCGGYAFGVHFSTFLGVLLPNTTPTSPLGHKTFLAIWVLSALVCLAAAGKWKYAAITLISMSGFCAFAMAIAVIVHPSLLTRVVLVAVFTPLGTVLCLLPFPRYARPALALAAASVGSFGMVMTIALFAHNPSWSNVWDRLWIQDGADWGTSKEKGLSAAYCFLLCAGLLVDWYLHNKVGENPDEKWDRYLADYSAELPNDARRAGTFAPIVSFWDRLLGRYGAFAPVVQDVTFPTDTDMKFPLPTSPGKLSKQRSVKVEVPFPDASDSKTRFTLLQKKGSRREVPTNRTRRAIKFSPHDDLSDSDDEASPEKMRPQSLASRTDSSSTLIDAQRLDGSSLLRPPERRWTGQIPGYSDGEEDIVNAGRRIGGDKMSVWPPEFIRRHSTRTATPPKRSATSPPRVLSASPEPLEVPEGLVRPASRSTTSAPSVLPSADMTSVPATPSLIKAVERINMAHEAMSRTQSPIASAPPPSGQVRKVSWDAFWDDVKAKAHH